MYRVIKHDCRGIAFLDMLSEWLLHQLNKDSADFILQRDIATPNFH